MEFRKLGFYDAEDLTVWKRNDSGHQLLFTSVAALCCGI